MTGPSRRLANGTLGNDGAALSLTLPPALSHSRSKSGQRGSFNVQQGAKMRRENPTNDVRGWGAGLSITGLLRVRIPGLRLPPEIAPPVVRIEYCSHMSIMDKIFLYRTCVEPAGRLATARYAPRNVQSRGTDDFYQCVVSSFRLFRFNVNVG